MIDTTSQVACCKTLVSESPLMTHARMTAKTILVLLRLSVPHARV
ncbi:hypothetical protein [Streptomyces sp. NPDC003278]